MGGIQNLNETNEKIFFVLDNDIIILGYRVGDVPG